jgi:serine/threonine-protein kinase
MVRLGKYEAVLIDFELAEEFDHPLISKSRAEQFAPIELNSSKTPRGAYTDVYSLAATLYVLLTGQMPVKAVDRKNAKASLIPPKEINPQISARVNQAILAGMSVESELRPQTMGEWLNLLELRRGISIPCLPWEQPRWVMVLEILGVVGVLAGVISATINITDFLQKDSSSPYPSPIPSATPKAEVTPTTKSLLILSEVPGKGSLEQ